MLGFGELIVVLFVVVLVFGANKIPALGDGLGRAVRNFRKAASGDEPPASTPAAPAQPPAAPPASGEPPPKS